MSTIDREVEAARDAYALAVSGEILTGLSATYIGALMIADANLNGSLAVHDIGPAVLMSGLNRDGYAFDYVVTPGGVVTLSPRE